MVNFFIDICQLFWWIKITKIAVYVGNSTWLLRIANWKSSVADRSVTIPMTFGDHGKRDTRSPFFSGEYSLKLYARVVSSRVTEIGMVTHGDKHVRRWSATTPSQGAGPERYQKSWDLHSRPNRKFYMVIKLDMRKICTGSTTNARSVCDR